MALFSLVAAAASAQDNAVPLVNQPLSPTSVQPGHRAFTLNVTGSGFAPGAVVKWNGVARGTMFLTSSHLQAAILASDVARMGTALVTVVNPPPGGGTSNFVYFPIGSRSATISLVRTDVTLPSTSRIGGLAVGDFNKDGKLDVALTAGPSTVDVLLGNGDGTFQAPISTTLELVNNSSLTCGDIGGPLVVGDFDGDGNLDFAFSYYCSPFSGAGQSLLYTALGTGDGHFIAAGDGTVLGGPLATGDVNSDGNLDVLTTNSGYDGTTWFPNLSLGAGSGLFGGGIGLGDTYAYGIGAFGDFNHDDKLDLALPGGNLNQEPLDLYTFLGNGDGAFQSPLLYSLSGRGFDGGTAAVADFNGDGNLDIAVDGVFVFLGKGDGSFANAGGPSINYGGGIQIADFNDDNKLDAVLIGNTGYPLNQEVVTLLLGNGDGTFQNPQTWGALNPYTSFLAIGDFNRDGRLDLVSAGTDESGASTISVFLQSVLFPNPGFLSFGSVKVGTNSGSENATLTNIGETTVTLKEIRLLHGGSSYSERNDCGTRLAPGASCTFTIVFSPKSKTTINASVDVIYSGGIGRLQSITLTGSGD